MRYRGSAILFLVLFYTGCAASGAGKKGGGESYHAPLGIFYRADFFGVSQHILLNKYQYQFVREEENPRLIYFETAWKSRSVYADEVAVGIREVQSRIRISAKARHAGQYKIVFYAANNALDEGRDESEPGAVSQMCREYFDQIAKTCEPSLACFTECGWDRFVEPRSVSCS